MLDVVFDNRIHNLVSGGRGSGLAHHLDPTGFGGGHRIGAVDWVVCASPGYADAHPAPHVLADLQAHAIVCASPVGQKLKAFGVRGDGGAAARSGMEPTLSSENFAFLKGGGGGGPGHRHLPLYAIGAELADGALRPLLPGYRVSVFGNRLYMLTMPNRYQTLATRYLMNFLKSELQAVWPHPAPPRPPPAEQARGGRRCRAPGPVPIRPHPPHPSRPRAPREHARRHYSREAQGRSLALRHAAAAGARRPPGDTSWHWLAPWRTA